MIGWTELVVGFFAFMLLSCPGFASEVKPPLGPGWCEKAQEGLTRTNGKPLSCDRNNLRCVKMNNYGCLKQPSKTNYRGTDWGGYIGARDHARHAIFSEPEMSIAAIANIYRRYQANGLRTGSQIAAGYSPWCDTLGSLARKADSTGAWWYPTCSGDKKPPQGARTCSLPRSGKPSTRQCEACNCPSEVARQMLKGKSGYGIDDDLRLFDSDIPSDLLFIVIANKMKQELGYAPKQELLDKARAKYAPQDW